MDNNEDLTEFYSLLKPACDIVMQHLLHCGFDYNTVIDTSGRVPNHFGRKLSIFS